MQNEWKENITKKRFVPFWPWLQKRIDPRKFGSSKGQNLLEISKKVCKAEDIQTYSKMSECKAAFTERTIGSRKKILYRYMQKYGYKYIHNLSQLVTTLSSRRNSSRDLIPKNIKTCDILSSLYSKPVRKIRKPKFKIGERVRIL